MISKIKLYLTLLIINSTIRLFLTILFTIVIRIIYLKYQVVYAVEYYRDGTMYDHPVVTVINEKGDFYSIIMTGHYEEGKGYLGYRVTKSEQAYPGTERYLTREQYNSIKDRETELVYEASKRYQPIPEVAQKAKPCITCDLLNHKKSIVLPIASEINIDHEIKNFNYENAYKNYCISIAQCITSKNTTVFAMTFMQFHLPEYLWSSTPEDVINPNAPINKFLETFTSRVPIRSEQDIMFNASFKAAVTTYNADRLINHTHNLDLTTEVFITSYTKLLEQMLGV